MGLIFRGFGCFRVGKSIFSRYGGYNTKKVPKKCLRCTVSGHANASPEGHPHSNQTSNTPVGVHWRGLQGFSNRWVPFGARWHDSGAPTPTPPHDIARYRTISDLEQTTNWSPEVKSCPWLDRPGRFVQFGSEKNILLIIRSDI